MARDRLGPAARAAKQGKAGSARLGSKAWRGKAGLGKAWGRRGGRDWLTRLPSHLTPICI